MPFFFLLSRSHRRVNVGMRRVKYILLWLANSSRRNGRLNHLLSDKGWDRRLRVPFFSISCSGLWQNEGTKFRSLHFHLLLSRSHYLSLFLPSFPSPRLDCSWLWYPCFASPLVAAGSFSSRPPAAPKKRMVTRSWHCRVLPASNWPILQRHRSIRLGHSYLIIHHMTYGWHSSQQDMPPLCPRALGCWKGRLTGGFTCLSRFACLACFGLLRLANGCAIASFCSLFHFYLLFLYLNGLLLIWPLGPARSRPPMHAATPEADLATTVGTTDTIVIVLC